MQPEKAVPGNPSEAGAVIEGKLAVPPLPADRVERPRVEDELAELIQEHRIVVVSATAGAGKTTAVIGALQHVLRPVAWLTLDWTDAAPGRLVTYVEAALAQPMPRLRGTVTSALAAGIAHAEAAGLLAEAVGAAPVVLVLDELERLADAADAWAVLETFLRYAPAGLCTVLISRRVLPATLGRLPSLAVFGEDALSFTIDEAAIALARLGEADVDPAAAVEATGGWVTGVLFEAWRSDRHVAGVGGEADPLHGYLAAHILEGLADDEREFLVTTALLEEVTAAGAAALGEQHAGERLAALRRAHLPVTWTGARMRCHSRFREYLLECLERRSRDEVGALRAAHGRLLASEGRHEDAVDELLCAGARAEALASAQEAIVPVIERLDVALAERWLQALRDVPGARTALAIPELMLAFGRHDYRRALRVVDGLAASGERDELARGSPFAAGLMAWTYTLGLRLDDTHAVLAHVAPDPIIDAVAYGLSAFETGPPPPRPGLSGGPFDVLVLVTDLLRGRLAGLEEESASRWIDEISGARRIACLRATGQTQRALELYEHAHAHGQATVRLEAWTGPEVLIDAGREDEARAAVARGRALARESGSVVHEIYSHLAEAKLELRLARDPAAARATLDAIEEQARPAAMFADVLDTWYGLALLLEGEDEEALVRLRRAVEGMVAGDRLLELPTAAAYLAEALWRAHAEDAADRAADVALDAARRLGSNHVLLQALADFPAVASRRIDAEPGADSPWHDLGRALLAQGAPLEARVRTAVSLVEFGRAAILVGGEEVRPRIAKTYELLAYLVTRPGTQADRDELLEALFDGRVDESARAYLRQAVRWLRHVLADEHAVVVERGRMRLSDDLAITGQALRFEAGLAEAARLQGAERLAATLDALAIYDDGEYLPVGRSRWVEERRQALAELAADARYEAAELAFAQGRLDQAEQLAAAVLEADPFREAAWRLDMRVAGALGDSDGVIRAYQRCERTLARLGTEPAPSTRDLLERLRR